MQQIHIQYHDSPCGKLVLASVGDKLCLCDWNEMLCAERNILRLARYVSAEFTIETSPVLEEAQRQLDEYFAGKRKTFDIPLYIAGTDFQRKIWNILIDIPYGEIKSYKDIAVGFGDCKAVRAVAQAIGANGISIFIPCHRVVGSNGSLTGYAGGLDAKRMLLEIEGIL